MRQENIVIFSPGLIIFLTWRVRSTDVALKWRYKMNAEYIPAHSESALHKSASRDEEEGRYRFLTLPLFHAGLRDPGCIYGPEFEQQN